MIIMNGNGGSYSSSRGGGSIINGDNNNFLGSLLCSLTFGFFDVDKYDA
jgi:hypothetical protein